MELKVNDAISRQVELWKQTDGCYQKAVLNGDTEKMLGLENCFVYMARETVFECMVYRLFVNSWGKSELKQKRRMEQAIAKKLSLV